MEFQRIDVIYTALSIRAQTEETTVQYIDAAHRALDVFHSAIYRHCGHFSFVATPCLALCVCLFVYLYVCSQSKLSHFGLAMVIATDPVITIASFRSYCYGIYEE